jgi:hypothetical protein
MLLAGVAMFWWAAWILATEEKERARLTQRAFQRLNEGMDNLAGKRMFVWVLHVIAISVGLLMVALSITSGRSSCRSSGATGEYRPQESNPIAHHT